MKVYCVVGYHNDRTANEHSQQKGATERDIHMCC